MDFDKMKARMEAQREREKSRSEDRELFELYLACLGGWHANQGANSYGPAELAEHALKSAKVAQVKWRLR